MEESQGALKENHTGQRAKNYISLGKTSDPRLQVRCDYKIKSRELETNQKFQAR